MNAVKQFITNPKKIRKAIAALVASALLGVSAKVVPDQVGTWLNVLQPVLVAYGVWRVPNEDQEA